MTGTSNKRIEKIKLLLVEGNDEVIFFESYLKFLKIYNIQVIEVKGKENFKNEIPKLKVRPGFSKVNKIGFIRDADSDFFATLQSMYDRLKENSFHPKKEHNRFSDSLPSLGIFIMPGKNQNGSLEDLCLKVIDDKNFLNCSSSFFNCLKSFKPNLDKLSKRKVQVYLATQDILCNCLGRGSQKKYWNFDSPLYDEIKDFIVELSR